MKLRGRKKPLIAPFAQYQEALPESDRELLNAFFEEFHHHCALPDSEKRKLQTDFEDAILYYQKEGLPITAALSRLDIKNLGGFYLRPPLLWYTLDDAAKVYPLSMKHGQMAVFRLSVYLKKAVVPEILQMALTFTIKRFPSFATTVKKGFFWHYLDSSKRKYAIEAERDIPCRPLKIGRSGSQSFRVLYYEKRISVEYFHILTDGTGGMIFLKTLTAEYLRLMGITAEPGSGILDINETPKASEAANEFARAEKTEKASGFVDKTAVQLGGRLSPVKPCQILHFRMDAERLKEAARERETTITAYVLSLLFMASRAATDELEGEFSIQVPVNMRKFYPSDTGRNFAMYCGIRLPITAITDVSAILPEITRQLSEKTDRAAMGEMMYATEYMVKLMRYIPLFIKAPIARIVYGFLGDRIFTNTLSNLGLVDLPETLSAHIDRMDFVLGTALTNRVSCAMVTCNGVAMLSVTKMTADPSFEEALYRLLEADGITPHLEGSELYEG